MPMIRLFGIRWNFASDDLIVLCSVDAVWRSLMCFILLLGIILNKTIHHHTEKGLVLICAAILLTLEVVTVLTLLIGSYLSTRGSVLDVNKRLPAVALFTWRLVCLFPLEIIVIGVSINAMTVRPESSLIPWVSVVVAFSFVAIVTSAAIALAAFDPTVWVQRSGRIGWITWLWHMRILTTAKCCCLHSSPLSDPTLISAYEGVAHSLSHFGQHDLVASDALAGLVVLSSVHGKSPLSFRGWHPDFVPTDWMTMANAKRYCCFALAIYSWPIYVYLNKSLKVGVKWLLNEYIKTTNTPPAGHAGSNWQHLFHAPEFGGHSYSPLDLKAVRLLLPDDKCEICYLDLDDRLFKTPFAIFADNTHRAVVVVIRGTMSIRDIYTDVCAVSHEFSYKEVEGLCHLGMYEVTRQVLKELEKKDLLKTVMDVHEGYQLVICGHSLGAGAAALVAMRLRESGGYPNTIGFGFSCPKTVTENLAVACNSFFLSLTVGHDVIARLAIWSFEKLKVEMIQALAECPLPKYKIFFNALAGVPLENEENLEDQLYNRLQRDALLMTDPVPEAAELHVPGCILHMDVATTALERPADQKSSRFLPRSFFKNIFVHPRMFKDHMPAVLLESVLSCSEP